MRSRIRPGQIIPAQRYRICVATLLVLFSSPSISQARWVRQSSGSLAFLRAIFFINEKTGWVSGSNGTLLMTTNGGEMWVASSKPTPDTLRDLYFSGEQDGWLLCETNAYQVQSSEKPLTYLLQTSDGGATWRRMTIGRLNPRTRLTGIVFSKAGNAWAFGEEGTILGSQDNWRSSMQFRAPTHRLLLGALFLDESEGWFVGSAATTLHTSDGGEHWQLSNVPDANQRGIRFEAISFANNHEGWLAGSEGSIYHTTDGGDSWQAQSSGITVDLHDIKFTSALEGWAVGDAGMILHTLDGGMHWNIAPSGTEHPLERIFFVTPTCGWIVGFGGTILRYAQ